MCSESGKIPPWLHKRKPSEHRLLWLQPEKVQPEVKEAHYWLGFSLHKLGSQFRRKCLETSSSLLRGLPSRSSFAQGILGENNLHVPKLEYFWKIRKASYQPYVQRTRILSFFFNYKNYPCLR